MEKLTRGVEFIFSSYKRTAAVLIIFGITLAIPVTLNFLGQQQDIRQQAQVATSDLRVFATSTRHKGDFGGILAADAICQQRAQEAGLTGVFKAWISDSNTDARDRIPDGSFVRMDGALIANNILDLIDKNIESNMEYDEKTQKIDDDKNVWTGTKKDGTRDDKTCASWTDQAVKGTRGKTDQKDEDWTDDDDKDCNNSYRIYCFEQANPSTSTPTPTSLPCSVPPVCLPGQTLVRQDPPASNSCPIYECKGTTTCGDGVCQNVACQGPQCPAPETPQNCPQDCLINPTATPTATLTPTATPTQTPTPTPTSHPSETRINLSLGLVGIGNATESARGINNRPKRPARNVDVKFLNSQNQEVLSRSGAVRFDSASGLYKGTITLGANFQGGPYIIKVRVDNTLWKQAPGIQNITAGQDNSILQPVSLITGDTNRDNEISIIDYASFIACYQGNCEATASISEEDLHDMNEFNDDGKIDELDLNILYSGFSRRKGD